MHPGLRRLGALALGLALLGGGAVRAQQGEHGDHGHVHGADHPDATAAAMATGPASAAAGGDARQPVEFPPELAAQTRAHMRDHLLALAEIQAALAAGRHAAYRLR